MNKYLFISLIFIFISCSEKNKNLPTDANYENENFITKSENDYKTIINSINSYLIKPIDSISLENNFNQIEKHIFNENKIEVYKEDNLNIDWIKINNNKIEVKKIKTINPRVNGENENMFCQSLEKIKLYKFKNQEIIFLQFIASPCAGIGCSVYEYLIYNVDKNQINLFGTFGVDNDDLYDFPIDNELNYISTEYKGDFHGNLTEHFISRVYSMKESGLFQLKIDKNDSEYFFEEITYPNDSIKQNEYKSNWFLKN